MENKKRVLLVEDDPVLQKLFTIVINQSQEYEAVVFKQNFGNILELVDWENIDIAVCDHHLGHRMNGTTILGYLKNHEPRVWRVMLTGDTSLTIDKANANQLLFKPVRPAELITSLRIEYG